LQRPVGIEQPWHRDAPTGLLERGGQSEQRVRTETAVRVHHEDGVDAGRVERVDTRVHARREAGVPARPHDAERQAGALGDGDGVVAGVVVGHGDGQLHLLGPQGFQAALKDVGAVVGHDDDADA
jgi:hypothetical protein